MLYTHCIFFGFDIQRFVALYFWASSYEQRLSIFGLVVVGILTPFLKIWRPRWLGEVGGWRFLLGYTKMRYDGITFCAEKIYV